MQLYPYIYVNDKGEHTKRYSPVVAITCGQYCDATPKTARFYQFTLKTEYGISTSKNFKTPEAAFKYADKVIFKNFCEVILRIK